MRFLILTAMMMAGCSSPCNLSAHRPTSRWAKVQGPITVIHSIESLTPKQARGVAKDRKMGTLYLPDLRTIDKGVAAALAETTASSLHLCGLEELDLQSATELARYRPNLDHVLCLDRLVQVHPKVLEALANIETGLSLNGLRELDEKCIKALASKRLQRLELGGLRKFNAQATAELRFLEIKFFHLDGVEELSLPVAQALVKSKIDALTLTGLRKIDTKVAAILATWERGGKYLLIPSSIRRAIDQANKNHQ